MAEILSGLGISLPKLQPKKKPSISESIRNYDESTEEIRLRFEAQKIMEERERARQHQQKTGSGKDKDPSCSPLAKDLSSHQQISKLSLSLTDPFCVGEAN